MPNSDAIGEAVRGLQQRLQPEALELDLLRTRIRAGIDALERGEYEELGEADLDAALDRIADPDTR